MTFTGCFLTVLAGLVLSSSAIACQCGATEPPAVALKSSSSVFSGRAVAVSDQYGVFRRLGDRLSVSRPNASSYEEHLQRYGFEITFEVSSVWKGPVKKRLVVFTGRGGGDCGIPFAVGSRYLVYADTSGVLRCTPQSAPAPTYLPAHHPTWRYSERVRLHNLGRPNPSLQRTRYARR